MSYSAILRILFGTIIAGQFAWADSVLTLKEYQQQVTAKNESFKAGELQIKSFSAREAEAGLDFMPSLIGNYTYSDNRQVQSSFLYGSETITQNGSLGIQTKLRTGTLVNLNYTVASTQINGSGTFNGVSIFPGTPFYTASPALTLTQPLWKDFAATLSKATEDSTRANYRSLSFQQKYTNQQILFNSEASYWNLALTRQIVKFDNDSIERTDKILKWNEKRVEMNVTDRADLLQSEAALKAKQLQLQTDLEQMREAATNFNLLRETKGDSVPEDLAPLDTLMAEYIIKKFTKIRDRADIVSTLYNAEKQKADAKAGVEKQKPDISIFGTAQLNGPGTMFKTATGESWNADNPTFSAGLKLTIPLDRGVVNQINEGYSASAYAAEYMANQARFQLEQDWINLEKKYKDALSRLNLAKDLEKLQNEKLEHERTRFREGRTTSFQVLQFEDNFSDAQVARLRVENELISLHAQALLYNGENL